ncbi:hypothetical protein U1Q18_017773 [Sarracenia purpurea var. burkii]
MIQLKTEASKDQAAFMVAMEQYFSKEARDKDPEVGTSGKDPEVEIIAPPAPKPTATPAAPAAPRTAAPPVAIPPISAAHT